MQNQLYLQVLRRSQSEGPHQRAGGPGGGGVAACEPGPMAAWVHGRRRHVTEQQRPEHWLVSAPAVRLDHPPQKKTHKINPTKKNQHLLLYLYIHHLKHYNRICSPVYS